MAKNFIKKLKLFRYYFYPNRDEIGREREKKNLSLNTVPTRPGLENLKKNRKKIQKSKKHHSALFLSKLG